MNKILKRIELELYLSETLIWFLLIGLSFILFGSTFESSLIWDDRFLFNLTGTPNPDNVSFIKVILEYSWPVTFFINEYLPQLLERNFEYYKIINISLHFLNAFILKRILTHFKLEFKLEWFIILVFIIHPYQQMAVSWMIQIKTLLATTFLFLSVWYFFKIKRDNWYSLPSVLFFLLSLKTKFFAILLPFSLILIWPRKIKSLVLYMIISSGVFIQFFVSKYFVEEVNIVNVPVGASRLLDFKERISIVYYLLKHSLVDSILPFNTYPLYNYSFDIYSFIFYIVALCALLYLTKNNFRLQIVFFINIVIFSGLMVAPYMRYTPISDQNFYHLMPIIAIIIYSFIDKIRSKSHATYLVILIIISSFYSKSFQNESTFFTKALQNSNSHIAYINLSSYYLENDDIEKAISILESGLDKVSKENQKVLTHQLERLRLHKK
jgi:hypothetical protein